MLPIEPEVRGQQPLLRGVPRAPATAEVEQQPSQVQGGNRLGQVEAEEAVGDDGLRDGEPHTLVTAQSRDRKHGIIFAFHEPDGERGLTGPLPRHACLGIHPLREIDQFRQFVALVRIDSGGLGRFEHSDVVAEIRRSPVCARCRRDLTAEPLRYGCGFR